MKEQIKTPERAKQNRDKQSIRYRVQKLSIRMLKEPIGYFNNIIQDPGRNEVYTK